MTDRIPSHRALIAELLDQEPSDEAMAMAAMLAKRPGVVAILFYGNKLRESSAEGLLDFYVLTESDRAYHGFGLPALANRLLPPNVYHEEIVNSAVDTDKNIHAKVAVIRLSSFRRRMGNMSLDTTLWARFSQPALLLYSRDKVSADAVTDAIVSAYETGAWWAAYLSPPTSTAREAWEILFQKTYGAELRVEGHGRAKTIVDKASNLYETLHQYQAENKEITPQERTRARKSWARRRFVGKVLNVMRLIKAAFTFRGGISYALSKVERHSGQPIELSGWQKRFPRLAVPFVFIRLLVERRLR